MAADPLVDVPEGDEGSETQDRYAWQHHCTAVDCIEMLTTGRAQRVVVEMQEDYVVEHGDATKELVSCKHRDEDQGPFDLGTLCTKGGLAHLFGRFHRFPQAQLRLMTNASLKPGADEAQAVWDACMKAADGASFEQPELASCRDALARGLLAARHGRVFDGIPETPRPGRGGRRANLEIPADFLPHVERFMRVLLVRSGLPQRNFIETVHASDVMRPCLESVGLSVETARPCYIRLVEMIHLRNKSTSLTAAYPDWLTNRLHGTAAGAQAALVEARSIWPADVMGLLRLHAGSRTARSGHSAADRLKAKLVAGQIGPNRRELALKARSDFHLYWGSIRSDLPGDAAMLSDLERTVMRLAGEIESEIGEDAFVGGRMFAELEQRLQGGLVSQDGLALPAWEALGLAMDLAGRCGIWFSAEFDVEQALDDAGVRREEEL